MDEDRFARAQRLFDAVREQPRDEQVPHLEQATDDPDLREQVLQMLAIDCEENLFRAARELPTDEQVSCLEQRAPDDPELRERVLSMLADDHREADTAMPTETPESIGPYKILATIGEGGMGTVYLAAQSSPVRRKVALKLIKLGMDSKSVVRRFERERQALALMQHVGIAQVYDCGTTDRGQPYFVMEYIKGVPLTDYCDGVRMSLKRRILLMRQVCAAVTHAHQKGVVHRDLKPGNVLVTEECGKPQIKVIDFGLAKAMGQRLVEATLCTDPGGVIGTPEYMAPEQADPANADIDTRADVYSIGVMLYELLVGSRPFTAEQLRRAGPAEMQRMLREVEPEKPSTRLRTIGDKADEIASGRRIAIGALRNALRSDLDWLVLKALEKDCDRRYETANALSADLQRYLDHEPLLAGPPSAAYRLRKLVRRYRSQMLAGVAIVATAISGAGVAIHYAAEASESASRADANARVANRRAAAEAAAKREADTAKREALARISEFNQLKGVVLFERAVAAEDTLYPAWPNQIARLESWLRDDCGKLLTQRPAIEATVAALRDRALPATAAEQQHDLESAPRYVEWQRLRNNLAALRYAQAIRAGSAHLVEPKLTPEQRSLGLADLSALVEDRIALREDRRRIYGQEPFALACARLLARRGRGTRLAHRDLDTLARALLANGQDAAARQQSAAALAAAPAADKKEYAGCLTELTNASANAAKLLASTASEYAALTVEVHARRTFRFEDGDDYEAPRFLHDALSGLLRDLDTLATVHKVAVEKRLAWARRIADLTLHHPRARVTWPQVRSAIARNERYRGQVPALRDQDIMGLVPIGMNPKTSLWEFYHLRSAWDGESDPRDIEIPRHDSNGGIEVAGTTGIVFVLLPGATFAMGAQRTAAEQPNFDAQASTDEAPVHTVSLSPFFLARHEMTKGQWLRLSGGERPSWYRTGWWYEGNPERTSYSHAVETVDWKMCERLLRHEGLVLPTEAQWEYGCRAGTSTPWWPGGEASALSGCANVLDQTGARVKPAWGLQQGEFDDSRVTLAPVGAYKPNGFGLYDVHGNVWEWCLDAYLGYRVPARAGDGLRWLERDSPARVNRGGCFRAPAAVARSSSRGNNVPSFRVGNLGLRPARALHTGR